MKTIPQLKQAITAAAGNPAALRKLLAATPELIEEPRLLNQAALCGNLDTANLLLAAGSDPDGQVLSHEYYRPLHRAIEHRGFPKNPGHLPVVKALLAAGASLEKRGTWMQLVPLAVAGMTGDREMIDLLHASEATIFTAAVTADLPAVRRFLKRKGAATTKDSNNLTPLHYAALSGLVGPEADPSHRQIAELLLDAGADPDSREDIGPYPAIPVLHFAAWKNYATAETLLHRGANPDFGFGNCLWRPPGPMAELFLSHGADPNRRESSGQPLLNSRIHWNLPSVALWLLKNGADPNLTDKLGNTALHEAAIRGINPKVVEAILKQGGRRTAKNHAGATALDLAKKGKRTKLIPLLK